LTGVLDLDACLAEMDAEFGPVPDADLHDADGALLVVQLSGSGAVVMSSRWATWSNWTGTTATGRPSAARRERATELVRNNQEHLAHADAEQGRAADEAARAGSSAEELQSRCDTLALLMQAWAQAHAAADQEAIEQTVARMEARGLRVTHRP
jgi:hypothetical protein